MAAWIRAETGVGPSIASGSQTWSGNWALLPTAPQNTSSAIAIGPWPSCAIFARSVAHVQRAGGTQMAMIPSAKPTSPTRLTMKAFLAASAAERRGYQKPISR